MPITIDHAYISRADINQAIDLFKSIQAGNEPMQMELEATQKIWDIDILFIGYLLLFKCQLPSLSIVLHFPKGIDDRPLGKLKQLGLYGYVLTGMSIFVAELPEGPLHFDRHNDQRFGENEFVLSQSFMLLLLIRHNDHRLFRLLFETNLSQLVRHTPGKGIDDIPWTKDNDALYSAYFNRLAASANPKKRIHCLVNLGQLAFFNCLSKAKVLPIYVDWEYKHNKGVKRPDLQASNLESTRTKGVWDYKPYVYYERIEQVFLALNNKPLIYQFVFSSLLAKEIFPTRINIHNEEKAAAKLWDLWQFTENLVRGLYELAKNIRDHADTGIGVITAGVIHEQNEHADPNTLLAAITGRAREGNEQPPSFLDIHVVDLGKTGIIPTFLQKSITLKEYFKDNEMLSQLIQEDIDHLQSNAFRMEDLFSATGGIRINQQCKRAVAHIGLLTLSKLIEVNEGILKVDTLLDATQRKTLLIDKTVQEGRSEITHGTFFTIILPLQQGITYKSHLPGSLQIPAEPSPNELKGIENLFDFHYLAMEEEGHATVPQQGKYILGHRFAPASIQNREDEHQLWQQLVQQFKPWLPHTGNNNSVVHLNLQQLTLDASALLRLAGHWEVYYPHVTLLLSHIPHELYNGLMKINQHLSESNPNIPFWNEHTPLLIYSYGTDEEGDPFYFTDIFLGRTFNDFYAVNKLVQKNHFNATCMSNGTHTQYSLQKTGEIMAGVSSAAFISGSVLLPFDLLLTDEHNVTLFENDARMLLKNKIRIGGDEERVTGDVMAQVKSLPGYKVTDSHYRIGSKLHIADFYYAKRIFQNNFFASRFAFLLTREILASLQQLDAKTQQSTRRDGLTLVGYGLYAELMVSLLKKFLKNSQSPALRKEVINHYIVNDEAGVDHIRAADLYTNIIIVVPIASTFSTAIKIEEKIRQVKKKEDKTVTIIPPHYNILHVASGGDPLDVSELEEEFGWKEKIPSKKQITLDAFFDTQDPLKVQQYFISLPATWMKIENCSGCHPVDATGHPALLEERPLFETDRTSVTPSIIFAYPQGRQPETTSDPETTPEPGIASDPASDTGFHLLPDMIRYGHYAATNNHFIYSVDTEAFLEKNLPLIRPWLRRIRKEPSFSTTFPDHAHTLIVASCHSANTGFISIVNEELFSSSANVIHYDPQHDFIQNFGLIYGQEIDAADRIIFVDDTLKSGDTFSKIQEFVKQVLVKKAKQRAAAKLPPREEQGIYACFILINKAEQFTHQLITEKLVGPQMMYGFANLHLYTSLSLSNTSTIHLEMNRYEKLIAASFLDSLKVYYHHKIQKLQQGHKQDSPKALLQVQRERHLSMIEATHLIYQYFAHPAHRLHQLPTFPQFLLQLHEAVQSPVIDSSSHGRVEMLGHTMLELSILKALSHYPFVQFEPLRRAAFTWTIALLDSHINRVETEIDTVGSILSMENFRGLKFILRRAALLNANYLLSAKMFGLLDKLYSPQGIPALRATWQQKISRAAPSGREKVQQVIGQEAGIYSAREQKELNDLDSFPVFFSAQVKELLARSAYRSIVLEPLLEFGKGKLSPALRHLRFILLAENVTILQKFYEWLCQDTKWKELYCQKEDTKFAATDNMLLEEYLHTPAMQNHQLYKSVNEFLKMTGQGEELLDNEPFKNFLWIRNYLDADHRVTSESLATRTANVFRKLRQIIENPRQKNTGIFLAIPNGTDDSYLVYDQNCEGVQEIDSDSWSAEKNTYLQQFLMGRGTEEDAFFQTMVELRKFDNIRKWKDLYHTSHQDTIDNLDYGFLGKEVPRLLLMRLSKRTGPGKKEEKPLGLVGIYFRSKYEGLVDTNTLRYLLLLKEPLADFVERHHHNNEFRELLNAEYTNRLAFLSGHGKEMLRALADKGKPLYQEIAWNLEHLQAIILLQDNIHGVSKMELIQSTFKKFYNISGSKVLDYDYFKFVRDMAREIYTFEEVETFVDCDVQPPACAKDFSFAFNQKIMTLIFFELIVNAKKNRWHFLDEDYHTITAEEKTNILHLAVRHLDAKKSRMQIVLTNIGPRVDDNIMRSLNNESGNVKPNDITAGTSLLKILIIKILGGKIAYDQVRICKDTHLYKIWVTITLPEMQST